jgi:Alcohol dehydrogenase GroES-associated
MSATEVRVSQNQGAGGGTMKAVNYQGAFKVKVEDVPMPKIEHPDDVVVKVTTAGELAKQLLGSLADGFFVFPI